MRRFRLRLIALLSLSVYLLANTQASFALGYLIRSQTQPSAVLDTTSAEESTPKASKCKHCTVTQDTTDENAPAQTKCPPDGSSKPCNDSSCPCCPNEHDPKDCPCPGGCALCSVAKAPCLTPLTLTPHQAVCIGQCCLVESLDYVSPPQGGLIRPPRA